MKLLHAVFAVVLLFCSAVMASPPPGKTDLLKLIDPDKHLGASGWKFDGKVLVSADSNAIIPIPFTVPDEYIVNMTISRRTGNDVLHLGLAAGEHQCALVLDGWLGAFSGLDAIDGNFANDNETTRRGGLFKNGKTYQVVVTVKKDEITASVDGERIVRYTGRFDRFSIRPEWRAAPKHTLFLNTLGCSYAISKLELTPLSGPATPIAMPPEKLPTAKEKTPAAKTVVVGSDKLPFAAKRAKTEYGKALEKSKADYIKALDAAIREVTKAGDLDGAVAIKATKEAFSKGKEAEAAMPEAGKKARLAYDEMCEKAVAAYIKTLDEVMAAEMKKGNLDGALAVRAEKETMEKLLPKPEKPE
jgi:hypothetical protein